MRNTIVLALLAAAVLVAPAAAAKHTVEITSGKIGTGTETITVEVANFNLVPFAGKSGAAAHVKGEGHIHYLVNDKDACSAGKADCAAPTDYATTAKTFTFKNLKSSDKVTVELVLSDHTPSGTDASGTLDGSRVLTTSGVSGMGIPSPAFVLVGLALLGAAVVARRKA